MIKYWKQQSITVKTFLITTLLLIISDLILYLILYFFLPVYYYSYKNNTLNSEVTQLVQKSEKVSLKEALPILDEFVSANNVGMIISDKNGQVVYVSSLRMKLPGGTINLTNPGQKEIAVIPSTNGRPKVQFIQTTIRFADGHYFLYIQSTLQPIDEAAKVILMFMPYISIVVLIVSVAGSIIYSKMITKPLLHLNNVARHMASLDFSQRSDIQSEDEIGELSHNLNELSSNLQTTMSELHKANEKLKDDIQKEREMEQKRREFIATISHELKSPITVVKGQLEGMIYEIGAYKDRDKYLKRSYEIMNEMENLVREVLELSKIESKNLQLKKEPLCLSEMIQSTLRKLDYFSQTKQLEIHEEIQENIFIQADPNLLEKAISNVLDNAMKYSKEGEKVAVKLFAEENNWVFHVLNTGVNIDEESLPQLFEPFFRLEKSRNRNTGGSGLGLYIVKQVLDLHGFSYEIGNTPDGVLFSMKFPKEFIPPSHSLHVRPLG